MSTTIAPRNNDANEVIVHGRLVKISPDGQDGNQMVLTVETRNGKVDTSLRFHCPTDIISHISVPAFIKVRGYVTNAPRLTKAGEWRKAQMFVAEEVNKDEPICASYYGLVGNLYRDPSVYIFLSAEVREITEEADYTRLIIEVDKHNENRQPSTLRVSMKRTGSDDPKISIGDSIYTICGATTASKRANGKGWMYENIVIRDIAKVGPTV